MLDITAFTGEMGGMLALAFAMGAAAGWGFAQRTAVKMAQDRIGELKLDVEKERVECQEKIEKLEARVKDLEDVRFNLARGAL